MQDIDTELIGSLREQFRCGCSFVQLVRQIVQHFPERSVSKRERMHYLVEAFGLGPAGTMAVSESESFGSGKIPDSALNLLFIGDILRERPVWDSNEDEESWYAKLIVSSFEDRHRLALSTRCGLSESGWAGLSSQDRDVLLANETSHRRSVEDSLALAALVEALQNQVRELQGEKLPTEVA